MLTHYEHPSWHFWWTAAVKWWQVDGSLMQKQIENSILFQVQAGFTTPEVDWIWQVTLWGDGDRGFASGSKTFASSKRQ